MRDTVELIIKVFFEWFNSSSADFPQSTPHCLLSDMVLTFSSKYLKLMMVVNCEVVLMMYTFHLKGIFP